MPRYVHVLLPLSLDQLYTYSIPEEWGSAISPGMRVMVQFGSKRYYAAIIMELSDSIPPNIKVKQIESILDDKPIVSETQLRFWRWISTYYLCPIGDVMNAALPSGLKISSETRYQLNPAFDENYTKLNDEEYLVAEALMRQEVLSQEEIQSITGRISIHKLLRSLIEKSVIWPVEEYCEKYKPKTLVCIRLTKEYQNEDKLKTLLDKLDGKSPKQADALLQWFQLAGAGSKNNVLRSDLAAKASISPVQSLIKKGVLELYDHRFDRSIIFKSRFEVTSIVLSEAQNDALCQIKDGFENKTPVLLHGVTGSGKTEIYIKLIEEQLAQGKQVLYLLPEIALTAHLVSRIRDYFGEKVNTYHSRFGLHEKVEIWNRILENPENGKGSIVLGARSAVFLPFSKLGLIIVDEEHDASYKQQDPAPRYNARDLSLLLAQQHEASVLLGTATPSAESYLNCQEGRYTLVNLAERYTGTQLPEVIIVNLRDNIARANMHAHLSQELFELIQQALKSNRQTLLFQNRRGFSSTVECRACGWTPQCRRCDVSMTYHKGIDLLKCHYCGYTTHVPSKCPECKSIEIHNKGLGTEQIEDELEQLFPEASIARMDLETTRGKHAHSSILEAFEKGKTDILVGTQMITKGLDFNRVDVVGVINADSLLAFPDFRAHERAFQLLTQVSGRAGRAGSNGKAVFQVFRTDNPVVNYVLQNDFVGFMKSELEKRKTYIYPPYIRLIRIAVMHKELEASKLVAAQLANNLKKHHEGMHILGPEAPMIGRIKNNYIHHILIKLPRDKRLNEAKNKLWPLLKQFAAHSPVKGIQISIDVDPY